MQTVALHGLDKIRQKITNTIPKNKWNVGVLADDIKESDMQKN